MTYTLIEAMQTFSEFFVHGFRILAFVFFVDKIPS